MATFTAHEPDTVPFARRSARYLYRNGLRPDEVARALHDELDVAPSLARDIAIEARPAVRR